MKASGFTLIELLVTAGLVVLLTAAALPRFVNYSRQQDFAASSQQLVQCLRQAQTAASNPKADQTQRYVGVTISSNVATKKTICSSQYVAGVLDGVPQTARDLSLASAEPATINLASYALANTTVGQVAIGTDSNQLRLSGADSSLSMRLYFDAQAGGAVVAACGGVVAFSNCHNFVPVAQASGLPVSLALKGVDATLSGMVTVGVTGQPISFSDAN